MTRLRPLAYSIFLALSVGLLGCAGSQQTSTPPAAVGTWSYTVDSQQGTYEGTLTISEAADSLTGTIRVHDRSVGSLDVHNVEYADSTLTFDLKGSEYGPMEARVTLGDGAFEGTIDVVRYGSSLRFRGTKQRN